MPPFHVSQWFNAEGASGLEAFLGRVLVVEVFQMLCPGCVSHGLPQAQRIAATFQRDKVAVIGLHSVFEHHEAMQPVALQAFLHEYRIGFPVAVDKAGSSGMPLTMAAWGLEGTPSLVLIGRDGRIRARHLGQVADLMIGATIMQLMLEPEAPPSPPPA